MPKFQPGDMVRVVWIDENDRYHGLMVGDIGEVLELSDAPWVKFQRDEINLDVHDGSRCYCVKQDQLEPTHPQEDTMKIQGIYEEQPKLEEPYFWKLHARDSGEVQLIVVNKDGRKEPMGHILTLRKNGVIELHESVDPKFGLQLDDDGHVKTQLQ